MNKMGKLNSFRNSLDDKQLSKLKGGVKSPEYKCNNWI